MRPSFGSNLPQIVTRICQKAIFKHALVQRCIRLISVIFLYKQHKGFRCRAGKSAAKYTMAQALGAALSWSGCPEGGSAKKAVLKAQKEKSPSPYAGPIENTSPIC